MNYSTIPAIPKIRHPQTFICFQTKEICFYEVRKRLRVERSRWIFSPSKLLLLGRDADVGATLDQTCWSQGRLCRKINQVFTHSLTSTDINTPIRTPSNLERIKWIALLDSEKIERITKESSLIVPRSDIVVLKSKAKVQIIKKMVMYGSNLFKRKTTMPRKEYGSHPMLYHYG